jgi:hypothetical protein
MTDTTNPNHDERADRTELSDTASAAERHALSGAPAGGSTAERDTEFLCKLEKDFVLDKELLRDLAPR